MARGTARVPRTDRYELLSPLLDAIAALREHYKSATAESLSDTLVDEIKDLLGERAVRDVLTPLLDEQRGTATALTIGDAKSPLAAQEARLGPAFGYEPKEVSNYLKRACKQGADGAPMADIATVDDLLSYLDVIQLRLRRELDVTGLPWQKWSRRKSARERAQDGLFHFGAIVADGSRTPLFKLSYKMGTTGLAQGPAHG